MADWYRSKGRGPRLSLPTIEWLTQLYLDEGEREGMRGDIAFCQACKETAYFTYGGDVQWYQNNYCGLGATGGVPGLSFPDATTGVRAHIQHLHAYAVGDAGALRQPLVDPRYRYVVSAGKHAETWTGLNGQWAVPGVGYGESILALYAEMRA